MTHMIVIAKNDLGLSGGQVCTLFPNSSTSKKKNYIKTLRLKEEMTVGLANFLYFCLPVTQCLEDSQFVFPLTKHDKGC